MNFKKGALKRRNQSWLTLITFNLIMLVSADSLSAEIWTVILTAKSGDSAVEVSFGVVQDATDDYDVDYDVGIPPPSPEKAPLSMSFANELTPLEKDIRGPVTSGEKMITWTLNIDSDAPGKLIWDPKRLPAEYSLNIEKIDMRMDGEISFNRGRNTLTITAVLSDFATYNLTLQEGINFISVPLNPSWGSDETPWRLSQLIDFIGPGATMIIGYDQTSQNFGAYMPHFPETSPFNTVVQGGKGYIVIMNAPANVTLTGSAWDGKISLTAGINVISVPLNPGVEWRLSDLMSFIGEDATMVISYNKDLQKFSAYMPNFPKTSILNTVVRGGEGYIVIMKRPADVVFTGTAWENTTAASEGE